jgi:hypothetical protein
LPVIFVILPLTLLPYMYPGHHFIYHHHDKFDWWVLKGGYCYDPLPHWFGPTLTELHPFQIA